MYIPDPERDVSSGPDAPIRFMSAAGSKQDGVAAWDSPNYLTGLAGAFVTSVSLQSNISMTVHSSLFSQLGYMDWLSGLRRTTNAICTR